MYDVENISSEIKVPEYYQSLIALIYLCKE